MWQAYPYYHGKLKLTKDLKTANAHLRASLIEQEQINNMSNIFNQRKKYYKIDAEAYIAPTFTQEPEEQEATAHLSYKDKVDLYRRRVQNEKLENKYKSLFKKTEKRRHKMRNPVLFKMLQQFQDDYKHDQNVKIAEDIKQSEKNLQMIKINSNRKALYGQKQDESPNMSRPRFISLKNSLPEKQPPPLPRWIDYIQGRTTKVDKTVHTINIAYLENTFDSLIGNSGRSKKYRKNSTKDVHSSLKENHAGMVQTPKQIQDKQKDDVSFDFNCNICQKEQKEKKKSDYREDSTTNNFFKTNRRKTGSKNSKSKRQHSKPDEEVSSVAERTFTKSQFYSKGCITTMSNFYDTKHSKRDDYKKMVHYLKNDRPLTSDIRRRNYKVVSTENIQQIQKYRAQSQLERLTLKHDNHEFYLQLLRLLDNHHNDNIRLSGQILDRTRNVLESNYLINQSQMQYITEPCLRLPPDAVSEDILYRIRKFVQHHP